jgi:hypothetical protein
MNKKGNDMYAYTSLDAPDHGDSTKDALEQDHKDLVYKLQSSNDFTICFAVEDLNEFAHLWGFEHSLDVVKETNLNKDFKKKAITALYSFLHNHSYDESDYKTLVEYLIGGL